MRVSNFGHNLDSKMVLRLIRGSTYTRVYTVVCFRFNFNCIIGAFQIIRDTLGGRGVIKNFTGQFLLVISLVKVDKKCHMGGGGLKSAEKVSRIF